MNDARTALLIGLGAALVFGAEGRQKLWDLDLSKISSSETDSVTQIWGISFSPDERTLATGFGPRWNFDPHPRRVVLVAIDHPETVVREFEVDTGGSPVPSAHSLVWSPSGAILMATGNHAPVMLRMDAERPCVFPRDSTFGGFLSGDRMVILSDDELEIRVFTPDCSLSDSWAISGRVNVFGTSPEQDLLAIESVGSPGRTELVSVRDHKAKQTWNRELLFGGLLFADQGRLVCGQNSRLGKQGPDAACRDTHTGAKVSEDDKVSIGQFGVLSAGGDLLAFTDSKFTSHQGTLWRFLDMNDDYQTSRRQVLWNVLTGREVASWENVAKLQQKELWGRDPRQLLSIKTEFVLSISRTGKYMAEGGSGRVSVYTVLGNY
jgi:hypothetical protein